MTSTIKVDNIQDQCGSAVVTKCGASKTLTVTTTKADNYQAADGGNIINQSGTTITLGASGDTVTLASGASQTGFGRSGSVNWDTTAKTADFTAVSGNGYFVNTTSGAVTVTLPASPSAGDIVSVADYAGTAATNTITIARNGSNFEGGTANGQIATNRQAITLVYVDGTQGWLPTNENDSSFQQPLFVTATGGTITTCGNFKIHTFTGPGTFCVSCAGNPVGSGSVDYLVVAGGGGAGGGQSGGGGGGGYRESTGCGYTSSPLGCGVSALPVTVQGYPITVGAGGSGKPSSTCGNIKGCSGANSIFSTVTSTGGGGGGANSGGSLGRPGGSGGGGSDNNSGGTGNTPPVSPPQGNNGGPSSTPSNGGGGGGAGAAGSPAPTPCVGANGGNGATTSINSSPVTRAGGGGGGGRPGGSPTTPQGGSGGGGNGSNDGSGSNGTTNSGGGGGGVTLTPGYTSGNGGSGIVIIRYKYQ